MTDRPLDIGAGLKQFRFIRGFESFGTNFKTPLIQAMRYLQSGTQNLGLLQIGLSTINTFSGVLYRAYSFDESSITAHKQIVADILGRLVPIHFAAVRKFGNDVQLSGQQEHILSMATSTLSDFACIGFLKDRIAAKDNLLALAQSIAGKQLARIEEGRIKREYRDRITSMDVLQLEALRGLAAVSDTRAAQLLVQNIERNLDISSPKLLAEMFKKFEENNHALFVDDNLTEAFLGVSRVVVANRYRRLGKEQIQNLNVLANILNEWSSYLDFSDLCLSQWQEANLTKAVEILKLLEEHRIGLGLDTNLIFQKWLDPGKAKTTSDFSEYETEVLGYLEKLSPRRISNLLGRRERSGSETIILKNFSHTERTARGSTKYTNATINFEFVDPENNAGCVAVFGADRGYPNIGAGR